MPPSVSKQWKLPNNNHVLQSQWYVPAHLCSTAAHSHDWKADCRKFRIACITTNRDLSGFDRPTMFNQVLRDWKVSAVTAISQSLNATKITVCKTEMITQPSGDHPQRSQNSIQSYYEAHALHLVQMVPFQMQISSHFKPTVEFISNHHMVPINASTHDA